jgi:hypothetical protein
MASARGWNDLGRPTPKDDGRMLHLLLLLEHFMYGEKHSGEAQR